MTDIKHYVEIDVSGPVVARAGGDTEMIAGGRQLMVLDFQLDVLLLSRIDTVERLGKATPYRSAVGSKHCKAEAETMNPFSAE